MHVQQAIKMFLTFSVQSSEFELRFDQTHIHTMFIKYIVQQCANSALLCTFVYS